MGTVVVYQNPYTTGRGIGFDNGPGSEDGDSDFNATVVLDTRSIYGDGTVVSEWQEDGVTHRGSVIYHYDLFDSLNVYVSSMARAIGGAQESVLTDFYLKPTYLDFYTGDALLEYVYSGNDSFYGSIAGDTLYGYAGSDTLYGNGGNDKLVGGSGQDFLYGGSGDDHLEGGFGRDVYYGGPGNDHVHYIGKQADYALSKHPTTNIITTIYENGFDKGVIHPDVEEVHFKWDGFKLDTSELVYVGGYSAASSNAATPVYRFYNPIKNTYFYTANRVEKDDVLLNSHYDRPDDQEWNYVFQGSTFNAASTQGGNTKLLIRFLNKITNHHMYSMDADEIAYITNNLPEYKYEGPAAFVYTSDPDPSDPNIGEEVWRYRHKDTGKHFWTADTEERNLVKLTGVWIEEGVAFWGE